MEHSWSNSGNMARQALGMNITYVAQGMEVYVQQPERRLGLIARLLGQAAHQRLQGAGLLSFLHSQLASSYGVLRCQ